MKKFNIAIWAAILVNLFIYGCYENDKKVLLFLIDNSISTKDSVIRNNYYEDFKKIITTAKGGDRIVVDFITSNSYASSNLPINVKLPVYDLFSKNRIEFDSTLTNSKHKILEDAKEFFFLATSSKTDIIGSLKIAEKVLNSTTNNGYEKKILVIFSDMILDDGNYNFEKIRLDSMLISNIIDKEKQKNKLPQLNGIKIWMIGAASENNGKSLDIERIAMIEEFWKSYFRECSALVSNDSYSPKLIDFYY